MSERLKYQGRLLDKQEEARRLKLRLDGLFKTLRDLLDPTEDMVELKGELIAEEALEFAARLGDYRALMEEIANIEKLLGV